jgi:parallel beta-helix repeat protein
VDNKTVYYITDSHSLLLNSSNCSNIGYLALVNCTDVTVNDIDLSNDEDGMLIAESTNTTLVNVTLANTHTNITLSGLSSQPLIYGGLTFFKSDNNLVINSRIVNNSVGVCLYGSSGNVFYHNSFVDVDKPVISNFQGPGSPPSGPCLINKWDDGYPSGGNYWSDYNGVDLKMGPSQNQSGSDGIGDTPYIIDANNTDRYPLMAPFNTFSAGTWNGVTYNVDVVSNSTISDFSFNATQKTISFNVAGSSSTTGFCRVTIPNALLGGSYVISVNGSGPLTLNEIPDGTHTFLYFTYKQGVRSVQIVGSVAVPEFPPVLVLPILVVAITVTIILTKTRVPRKTES